jgi:curli biogenesis system outer membrane secretion channel CsgG
LKLKSLFATALALTVTCAAFAAGPSVPAGSKVYVEAADGFDTYLTAALQKKKVPVVVVTEKDKADYELSGVSDHQKAGWAKVVFMGQIHSDEQAGVKLVNLKTGEVVFAYAVNKKNSVHGRQTAAESCAKHMKEVTGN